MDDSRQIAFHLFEREVACPCCGQARLAPELLAAWERFRRGLGYPVQIMSGYRCPAHNAAIGGSSHSQHLLGNALDIACQHTELESESVYRLLFASGFRGIGHGRGIFHIDVRPAPYFWRYTSRGELQDKVLTDLYLEFTRKDAC